MEELIIWGLVVISILSIVGAFKMLKQINKLK